MKLKLTVLTILTTTSLISEEQPASSFTDVPITKNEPFQNFDSTLPITPDYLNKHFFYGSFSLASGIGYSNRTRHGEKATALDIKLGILLLGKTIPTISVDYNWLSYFKKTSKASPYFSYGIGACYILPYVPLRAGIEFQHSFIDVGVKMVLGTFPLPEIRAGIQLKF